MRFVAAAGIAWFHAKAPGQLISYSALSFFIVMMIVLPLQRPPSASMSSFVLQRADRLIRPWLVWSCIYAVLKISQATVEKRPVLSEFDWSMLFMGTQTHLWFLPFGFVCSIAVFGAVRAVKQTSPAAFPTVIFLSFLSLPASNWALSQNMPDPLPQWQYGLPAVIFGMAISFADRGRQKLLWVSGAAVFGSLAALLVSNHFSGLASFFLGLNLALLVLASPVGSQPWTRLMGALSMPVYLIHPVFISLLQNFPGFETTVAAATGSIVFSAVLGYAIVKSRWSKLLL